MLLAKIECKNVSVEKLAKILTKDSEQGFKIWLYKKKVYAVFRVGSITVLKRIIQRMSRVKKIKFRFFRVEEEYERGSY